MIFARARLHLMLLNVVVMAVLIAALSAGIVVLLERELMGQATSELQADARRAAVEAAERDISEFQADHRSYATGTFYVLWSQAGDPFFNPADAPTSQLRGAAEAALAGRSSTQVLELAGGRETMVVSVPITEGGHQIGAVQLGRSLAPVHSAEAAAIAIVAAASAAALAAGVLGSWFLAGRALVPIRRALERERAFTADASHELRTPLAVVDAGLQVLLRHPEQTVAANVEVVEAMSGEARRMGRLVAGLLTLARADSGEVEPMLAEVDVDELVRTAAEKAALAGGVAGSVRVDATTAGRAWVDPDRVEQLLLILVENALRYSPPDQQVEVSCGREDRRLVIEVADRGPGVPAGQRDAVFERFWRLDPGRPGPGAGLGLPIARWIASLHGGSIALHDNRPGLRVRVVLGAGPPPIRPAPRARAGGRRAAPG